MADGSKVTFAIELDELVTTNEWTTRRDKIDNGGALGVANGFGVTRIYVNGEEVLTIVLAEDGAGKVTLAVTSQNVPAYHLDAFTTLLDLERAGLVPARSGRQT